ncbi:MAG: hypothetical protein KGI36_21210, partial [Burkholderiales bacterium]|nr:hypothetical protein [Burkholderiales bacterium]
MSENDPAPDPFAAFESERTVIKPSAGRGARAPAAGGDATLLGLPPAGSAPAAAAAALPELPGGASLTPLVQA